MSYRECKSRIYVKDDMVENKKRYKTANKNYVLVYVDDGDGLVPAMFTESAINQAIERAQKNPEDVFEPKRHGFLAKLFGCE